MNHSIIRSINLNSSTMHLSGTEEFVRVALIAVNVHPGAD